MIDSKSPVYTIEIDTYYEKLNYYTWSIEPSILKYRNFSSIGLIVEDHVLGVF